jgi:hypothetical protein
MYEKNPCRVNDLIDGSGVNVGVLAIHGGAEAGLAVN